MGMTVLHLPHSQAQLEDLLPPLPAKLIGTGTGSDPQGCQPTGWMVTGDAA